MFKILQKAALEAAKIQLTYFRTAELDVSRKTDHQNIVTIADKKSQDRIRTVILEEMQSRGIDAADVGFIGEEDLQDEGSHVFVIDPIDGTSNFASGVDYFCCSIAYFKDGVLTAGAIYRPVHDELYCAEKGNGAFCIIQGTRLPLAMKSVDTKDLIMSTNFGETMRNADQLPLIEKLMPSYRGVRAFGAVALDLAKVAGNEIGTSVDKGPFIWDISAGKIIIEEAGGAVFDWEGNDVVIDLSNRSKRYSLISCHPDTKTKILSLM